MTQNVNVSLLSDIYLVDERWSKFYVNLFCYKISNVYSWVEFADSKQTRQFLPAPRDNS